MNIGNRIKDAVREAGLSDEAMADKMEISLATVRRYYNKESFNTDDLAKISAITGKPMAYFLQEFLEEEWSIQNVKGKKFTAGRDIHHQKNIGSGNEGAKMVSSEDNIENLLYKLQLCEMEKESLKKEVALKDRIISLLEEKK